MSPPKPGSCNRKPGKNVLEIPCQVIFRVSGFEVHVRLTGAGLFLGRMAFKLTKEINILNIRKTDFYMSLDTSTHKKVTEESASALIWRFDTRCMHVSR